MFIDREHTTTISGTGLELGTTSIRDWDSDVRADVTMAGLAVDINDPRIVGDSTYIEIDGTARLLDLTTLSGVGYPMEVELDARGAGCYMKQGGPTVTLAAVNYRLQADDWRLTTVSGVTEAYFRVIQEDTTVTGVLVATRIDSLS